MRGIEKFGLALVISGIPAPVLAAGASGPVWQEHGYYLINFIVFLLLLIHFTRTPLKGFLLHRRTIILEELEEAQRLQTAAKEQLEKYEAKVADLEAEKERIHAAFIADGKREKERIIQEATVAAKKIIEDTERRIVLEEKKLINALGDEAVNLAITMADQAVRARMNEETQTQLLDDAIASMDAMSLSNLTPGGKA